MPSDDAAELAATEQAPEETFTLLDVDGSAASPSYRNTASAIAGDGDSPQADKWSRLAYRGVNMLFVCSSLAVAKQLLNPASFGAQEEAAQQASKALPSWFAGQYTQRRVGMRIAQNAMRDTGVLMAASGLWYGLQFALLKLRGEADALNACVAGSVSAGWLGATFIQPFKASRAGIWGAVGGVLGYYGFLEQQAMRAALLERQQDLEQKHLHVGADQVHQKLDAELLKKLLRMEQADRQEQLRAQVQRHRADRQQAAMDSRAEAPGSKGNQDGSVIDGGKGAGSLWGSSDGGATDNADEEWQKLLNSAPWLQDEEGQQ